MSGSVAMIAHLLFVLVLPAQGPSHILQINKRVVGISDVEVLGVIHIWRVILFKNVNVDGPVCGVRLDSSSVAFTFSLYRVLFVVKVRSFSRKLAVTADNLISAVLSRSLPDIGPQFDHI